MRLRSAFAFREHENLRGRREPPAERACGERREAAAETPERGARSFWRVTSRARARALAAIVFAGLAAVGSSTAALAQEIFVEGFESGTLNPWSAFFSGGAPVCPAPFSINFCRLQFPTTITAAEGTQVTVYGRYYEAGVTDQSTLNDPAPQVRAWVGYGPDGTHPGVDPNWVWRLASPNPGYDGSISGEPNNDEYYENLTVPSPPGTYDFAYRFSGDCGATFTYCDDGGAGSSNGYSATDAGQLTSQPAPPFFSEYAEGTSSNKALEIFNPSAAATSLDGCSIRFYFNGNVTPGTTIALSGALAAGDVRVVCDDTIDPIHAGVCDSTSGATFYNGDDAIELVCASTTLDVIGQIGFDPLTEWNANGVGTEDETLRRKCSVTHGDAVGGDTFDPSAEWVSFAADTFSGFGQHCP